MTDTIPQKRCSTCRDYFPATPEYFHRSKMHKDGLKPRCKICKNKEYQKSKEREHITVAEKQCTSCQNVFPGTSEFFHRNKANIDGLNSQCKACIKAYQNSPGTREHILAQKKEYFSRPDIKEREYERAKERNQRPEVRERNRQRDMERHRSPKRQEWIQGYKGRPEVQAHIQDYMQSYRPAWGKSYRSRPEVQESQRIRMHHRRARSKSAGMHTVEQVQELLKSQKHKCYYCNVKFEKKQGKYIYHVDHTFPIGRDTGDEPINDISYLVLACPKCNQSKSDKFPWEWHQGGKLL